MSWHKRIRLLLLSLLLGGTGFWLGRTLDRPPAPAPPLFVPSQEAPSDFARHPLANPPPQVSLQEVPAPAPLPLPQPSSVPDHPDVPPWGITMAEDRLSIRVQNRSLKRLLEEIATKSEVPIIVSADVTDQRVSLQFQHLPIEHGLRRVLHALDTFFLYAAEEHPAAALRAVWVYPARQGHRIAPVPPEAWASTTEILDQLTAPDPLERARAVEVVIDRQGKQALEIVLQALEDAEEQVRYRALYKTLHTGLALPEDVLQWLLRADPSPVVRFLALEALANGPGTSPEHLQEVAELALDDPSVQVQSQAQDILAALETARQPLGAHEMPPGQEGTVAH